MRRAALFCLALAATPASAARLAGVDVPDRATVGGKTLVLNGTGLREATVLMVDVYVAGLYLEEETSDPSAILASSATKRLTMTFVRSVGREKLAEAWTEGFDKNAGDKRAALAPSLATLNGAMADVKKDDTIVLTYLPETGVTVTVKGKDAAVIPGEDFQRVLFSIWLGSSPPNVGLREGLLGRSGGR
ncbi:MAG TPA: chalcone isomerase family protein [Candidatus Polarisedimenticolaceae bacterium]|nr:chalcone isomerase family protein [Candidatus Polarisedimenticolaceae bacterium]